MNCCWREAEFSFTHFSLLWWLMSSHQASGLNLPQWDLIFSSCFLFFVCFPDVLLQLDTSFLPLSLKFFYYYWKNRIIMSRTVILVKTAEIHQYLLQHLMRFTNCSNCSAHIRQLQVTNHLLVIAHNLPERLELIMSLLTVRSVTSSLFFVWLPCRFRIPGLLWHSSIIPFGQKLLVWVQRKLQQLFRKYYSCIIP